MTMMRLPHNRIMKRMIVKSMIVKRNFLVAKYSGAMCAPLHISLRTKLLETDTGSPRMMRHDPAKTTRQSHHQRKSIRNAAAARKRQNCNH